MTKAVRASKSSAASPDLRQYVAQFRDLSHELAIFMGTVEKWFSTHPEMINGRPPLIHSVKSRLKNVDHLREKLRRKYTKDGQVGFSPAELSLRVTDLCGVRVMHLHQRQFSKIYDLFKAKIDTGDWHLAETKAFTWDPESKKYFESLGLAPELRETFYTSVHFIIRPNANSLLVCEIQIRTLFEEIWGEIDHSLNYPDLPPKNSAIEN